MVDNLKKHLPNPLNPGNTSCDLGKDEISHRLVNLAYSFGNITVH